MLSQSTTNNMAVKVHLEDEFFTTATETNGRALQSNPIAPDMWQNWFHTWFNLLAPDLPEAILYELGLRLTGDHHIQQFNHQYRQLAEPTDVLAFAALEVDVPQTAPDRNKTEPLYLGDIVISVDAATRQAGQQGHSLTAELAWLAAHGFLHLLGWDHPDEDSLILMLAQQKTLLKVVGLPALHRKTISGMLQTTRPLAWQIAPNLLISFQYAGKGVRYAFITQRNFRIHTVISALALSLGAFLHITAVEMAVIGLTCALVLVLELLNTSIESVVDLTVGQRYHELAKIAKDCAAGAVLIAALAAVWVASYILVPQLIEHF